MKSRLFSLPILLAVTSLLLAACASAPPVTTPSPPPVAVPVTAPTAPSAPVAAPEPPKPLPVKIGLALGGGAARGFAHIGVIKVLEANGIKPEIIAGTSAVSVVGALYAAGYSPEELQKQALELKEGEVGDWTLPDRGVIKGEALQSFINRAVKQRNIENLPRVLGIVTTDLVSGERLVLRKGDTGTAVRASSAVPGVFKPVSLAGREYVDGGLTSPVPVRAAREMGADFVIAVDISSKPTDGKTQSTLDVLLQTFTIMGQSLGRQETQAADIVIRPATSGLSATDFKSRTKAIEAGMRAAESVLAQLITRLDAARFPRLARGTP